MVPGKTNEANYCTKKYHPSHHTVMRHEYFHRVDYIISFVPPIGSITKRLEPTSPAMSHEPWFPKSDHQEHRIPTYDHLTILLNKIHNIHTYNNIKASFNNITRGMDMIQKSECSAPVIQGQKNTMQRFCKPFNNRNNAIINLLMWFCYKYYYLIVLKVYTTQYFIKVTYII